MQSVQKEDEGLSREGVHNNNNNNNRTTTTTTATTMKTTATNVIEMPPHLQRGRVHQALNVQQHTRPLQHSARQWLQHAHTDAGVGHRHPMTP